MPEFVWEKLFYVPSSIYINICRYITCTINEHSVQNFLHTVLLKVILLVVVKTCIIVIRGVLGIKIHDFWKMSVWMCVCVCVCVCMRVCTLFYSVHFNRTGLIFFVIFLCGCGSKIRFLIGPMRFCFISNFLFSQNLFLIFFNGRVEIFESDIIRKRIKISKFSKKKKFYLSRFFCYWQKRVFFLKLITLKLNGQFFWKKSW